MKLNIDVINGLDPKKKQYKVFDGGGLFILVHPNGSKYWRINYRFNGKYKTLALGVYPDISLSEARAKLLEVKNLVAKEIDPSVKKQEQKNKKMQVKLKLEKEKSLIDLYIKPIKKTFWLCKNKSHIHETKKEAVKCLLNTKDISPIKTKQIQISKYRNKNPDTSAIWKK